MELKKKTAGKRTARPGNRDVDVLSNRKVSERKGADTAGRKTTRKTARHIVAHQRAAGRRRNTPGSK